MAKVHSKVHRIQLANSSGFLVQCDDALMLIDTGFKSTVSTMESALKALNLNFSDIDIIVLTHTHYDHAGGARKMKELSGAKLLVHSSEADYLRRGRTPIPKGTRWKGKLMSFAGTYLAPWIANYPSVEADILIEEEFDLSAFGIPAKIIHTPGHTKGSLTIILEDRIAFMGDNTFGVSDEKHYPPFADYPSLVLEAWERVLSTGVKKVFPAHGQGFDVEVLREELPRWEIYK